MQNNKLIKVLKSLSKTEFKYMGWFVRSNFFNTDVNLVKLYEELKKYYPTFDSNRLEKKQLFKTLYPTAPYSDGKMRNLFSKMNKLAEDYLIQLELKKNKLKKDMLLAEGFQKRGLLNEHIHTNTSIIHTLSNLPYRDEEYFLSMKSLYEGIYFQAGNFNNELNKKALFQANDNLYKYYRLAKLKLEGEFEARKALYETADDTDREGKLARDLQENILFKTMDSILQLYQHSSEDGYLMVKKSFFENTKSLRRIDQKFILKHLLGHAIRQLARKEEKYSLEVFDLYKFAHENDLLATNGKITSTTFMNIITVSARIREFVWSERFILESEHKLEPKTKVEIKGLGLANLSFYKKEYSQVMRLTSTLKFHDIMYEILAKVLSLKAYFELFNADDSYFDLISSYAISFEKFLKRNSQLGRKKIISITNFIKTVRKLTVLKYQKNKEYREWEKLGKELSEITVIERKWLASKINEK